jgi:hypothetical protein
MLREKNSYAVLHQSCRQSTARRELSLRGVSRGFRSQRAARNALGGALDTLARPQPNAQRPPLLTDNFLSVTFPSCTAPRPIALLLTSHC